MQRAKVKAVCPKQLQSEGTGVRRRTKEQNQEVEAPEPQELVRTGET